MKEFFENEYNRLCPKLKSKLNGENKVLAIKTWTVVICQLFGIEWIIQEIERGVNIWHSEC